MIEQINQNTAAPQNSQEVKTFYFDPQQSRQLHAFSEELAVLGGPQAAGARLKATLAACELKLSMSKDQCALLHAYSDGLVSLLIFEGLQQISDASPPDELPNLALLENRHDVLCLAARNQILLRLVDNSAFAYDMDNEGKLVRLVANFKGGGLCKIGDEPEIKELSSHSGLALGPHTEAPYWCAMDAQNDHSPSPSSLILSALWNPSMECTSVIALPPVLNEIGVTTCMALTTKSFQFTRSDSFVNGKGEDGHDVSILEFNDKVGLTTRFNSYRFSANENTPTLVKNAYANFCQSINEATPYEYVLTQRSAIIINNVRALHCRDIVKDNRRVLVRVFGLSKFSNPIVISQDPLLLQG
ncbi:MAG: hypothetical protein ACRESJ_10100 [Pseudomonas sp.]|uniref:hypothetical protein n=1 Tax=Pseudomonas sp. TaxID=306 RepID=UPI003D6DB11C